MAPDVGCCPIVLMLPACKAMMSANAAAVVNLCACIPGPAYSHEAYSSGLQVSMVYKMCCLSLLCRVQDGVGNLPLLCLLGCCDDPVRHLLPA